MVHNIYFSKYADTKDSNVEGSTFKLSSLFKPSQISDSMMHDLVKNHSQSIYLHTFNHHTRVPNEHSIYSARTELMNVPELVHHEKVSYHSYHVH